MDATQILGEFAAAERLPVETIKAARANRTALAPAFVHAVEEVVQGDASPETYDAVFLVFHLLGEWRERSAYRPLAALLRLPTDDIEDILGDATTDTSQRVMAAVFDGDPAPLYAIIRDPAADEFIRARMCEALAMVALAGELPREEAATFLRACFSELEPQTECFVWEGWQSAIAMLGLVELVPLVKQVFDRRFIAADMFQFEDFEADLQQTLDGAPTDRGVVREFEPFADTIDELSTWAYSEPEDEEWASDSDETDLDEPGLWTSPQAPAVNPYKGVGRNDPCPCGSGKKFKKCCLGKVDAPPSGSSFSASRFDAADVLSRDDEFGDGELEYDPLVAPDPEAWLALEEQERIDMVMDFHRRARIKLPKARVHATIHAVVENQIAEGDALPVRRTLERLMREGLDRHDAVHAIGGVLIGHMNDLMAAGGVEGDPNVKYYAELERLTAAGWRRSG
jgi:hypothetical protein